MLAQYGYSDDSGSFFITIDTERCNACGKCLTACPAKVFSVVSEDQDDPLDEKPVATAIHEKRKKLKYECGSCKPASNRPPLPCVAVCSVLAISHSW